MNIGEFIATKKFSYLHIGMVQVSIKLLTRKGINTSVLMCLRDARFKNFKDSILGMITASLIYRLTIVLSTTLFAVFILSQKVLYDL